MSSVWCGITRMLQCGHGLQAVENARVPRRRGRSLASFNAATAFKPWRTSKRREWASKRKALQCGHGLQAVENLCGAVVCQSKSSASMRPRPSSRGEQRGADFYPAFSRLQCGHGLQAVENPTAGRAGRPPAIRFNAATAFKPWRTQYRRRGIPRHQRFNAATAFKPWRTYISVGYPCQRTALQCGHGLQAVENTSDTGTCHSLGMLQCGHGLQAVENFPTTSQADNGISSFNAATAFKPWRTPLATRAHDCPRRFNAATAFKPWRTGSTRSGQAESPGLQCGHGLQAVENSSTAAWMTRTSCFNAATAFKPWRTMLVQFQPPSLRPASMRSRPSSRGEPLASYLACGIRVKCPSASGGGFRGDTESTPPTPDAPTGTAILTSAPRAARGPKTRPIF